MARKKAEAQQLQIIISNDQDWENACKRTGLLVVDVYQEWAGPCSSMTGHLRRIKLELGDEFLTLAMAKADNISVLEKFRGKAEPTWLFLGVLLESLVKPEEVLEPDEDLDDVEGEMQNLEDSEEGSEAEEEPLLQAVLFILPHIISQEKTETFLSNVVAAGESKEGGGEEAEEKGDEEDNEGDENEKEGEVVEDDLEDWEEKLSHGPLYMLYLKIEEGDVVAAWYQVLGPPDLEKARQEEPDSLVAQFGEEEFVVPAWLPRSRELQLRLAARFFPPPPDATVPRLLLLPDADHQEVLERMGVSGVQVLAHTQLTLQQEAIQSLPSLSASQQLASAAGSSVLAVVVAGEGMEECVQEFGPLHLSSDTASANAEVELFFPDFLAAQESQDEPQTQMQIEQSKEAK
ncbi:putative thioredoxin domain-containing protein 3-like [Penaeus vannamei]|uniref:Putative thioredoxin domain-containing protein 3-like n=1 Tax=Penaeus vannamei TaxID=6689 RepID=A0A3R7Q359_PENVA|nr:putative thioredoxin domain-containing protein 3-like [Penaeus vannamei]